MSRLMKGAKSIGAWFTFAGGTAAACEQCVFGRGPHMKGCPEADRPAPARFVPGSDTVKVGNAIAFSTMAPSWTRNCIFRVLRVYASGVLATCIEEPPGVFTSKSVKGLDYRAPWSEIAEVIPAGKPRRVNLGKLA
jgi:hypothetical protein